MLLDGPTTLRIMRLEMDGSSRCCYEEQIAHSVDEWVDGGQPCTD